ncbi:MAG: C1 family peptidase [Candidatus Dojkabacteria bacterium]|nr:C1 family peptidase [Candidatus Dojkabacteria bacterium]
MKKSNESNQERTGHPKVSLKNILVLKIIIYIGLSIVFLTLLNISKITDFLENSDRNESTNTPSEDYDFTYGREVYKVAQKLPQYYDRIETVNLKYDSLIYGLKINADILLPNPDSYARVVLVDNHEKELLVHESYLLLEGSSTVAVKDACEETCLLDGTVPGKLRIETEGGAKVKLTNINYVKELNSTATPEQITAERTKTLNAKIKKLNNEIKNNNLNWVAGKTEFAKLTYGQKKAMYDGRLPNFQGLEFYKGGVFETLAEKEIVMRRHPSFVLQSTTEDFVNSDQTSKAIGNKLVTGNNLTIPSPATSVLGIAKSSNSASAYVDAWDWRTQHGANDPSSTYFDGNNDPDETGNGWITSVKNQGGCGSCWAFAATGATEALANLYYNRHVDLDLSEQDALSCSGAGSCSGGWPGLTLDYYTSNGVVNEGCFPYSASDLPCNNKCSNPTELVKIGGRIPFTDKTEDNLKEMIVQYGPISGGVFSWSHAMTLVGWYTDGYGDTVWIFKNSWGRTWGDHGYLYLKTEITNIGWTHALLLPISDTSSRTIRCIDADGDGYYNWGLSANKPGTCPEGIPDQKDCNDFDPDRIALDDEFNCVDLPSDIYFNHSAHNFYAIPVGQSSEVTEITIGNQGTGNLYVSSISLLNTTDFSLDLNPAGSDQPCGQINPTVAPGENCSFTVIFNPSQEGSISSSVRILSSDYRTPDAQINISGIGSYEPEVVCTYFAGDWFNNDRCFGISDSQCTDYRGTVNECDSNCPPDYHCAQHCVKSCRF